VKVIQHIREFLYTSEYVIIPDFGAFKTNYNPAEIDYKTRQIKPPSKSVVFDDKLLVSDGLLANYISEKEKITKSEAKDLIFKFVTDSFVKLEQGNSVVFDNIGSFSFDKKRKLVFISEQNSNFLPNSYGLTTIRFQGGGEKLGKPPEPLPVNQNKKQIKTAPKAETTKSKQVPIKIYVIVGAMFVILAFAIAGVYTGWFSSMKHYVTSSQPNDGSDAKLYTSDSANTRKLVDNASSNQLNAKDSVSESNLSASESTGDLAKSENSNTDKKEYIEPKVKADSKKTFYIIAGSFSTLESANKIKDKYIKKGYNSEVLDIENGVYRVTLGSHKYKSVAMRELDKIRQSEGGSVWLLGK
jgi:nucleoid DNA-binding protein